MTNGETAKVLGMLAIEYDNAVITPERVDLWTELFRDVSFADTKAAVLVWFTDAEKGRFFPRPAELRKLVKATQPTLDTAVYKRYQALRSAYQAGTLDAMGDAELGRVEVRLGIAALRPGSAVERRTA